MTQPIVVFSHLRWDFVFQRPQHVLSRLAERRKVLFVEEPLAAAEPRWERTEYQSGRLHVCRAHLPGDPSWTHPQLRSLVVEALDEHSVRDPVVWMYTPMAWPLACHLHRSALVYDCMDELSLFLHAPRTLVRYEEEMLSAADVVFTGGPSLYRAKCRRHLNVHCFPSSVDAAHYATAREALPEPGDQAAIPHPRFGFFGVLDERLDTDVIDHLAKQHPDWHVVLLGPVVKIDPAKLPRRRNIHYLGQKHYSELPAYLAGWDVCLLPFARNDATKFISPTKTLEYMAAEKPIVSTPITDVAEPYGQIVYLGDSPAEFTRACERALNAPAAERAIRVKRMREVLARTSWDTTVATMEKLIVSACRPERHRSNQGQRFGSDWEESGAARISPATPAGKARQA